MIVWVDAQLSPSLAPWIAEHFAIEATSLRHLGLVQATDSQVFVAARDAGAIVLTKDSDFLLLLGKFGPPPQVLWVRCGNTSNAHLRDVLTRTLSSALRLLEAGEALVEIV